MPEVRFRDCTVAKYRVAETATGNLAGELFELMNKTRACFFVLASFLLCGFHSWSSAESNPPADVIVTHAKIWTVDPAKPSAQAVAILGDRIVAVGTDSEVTVWRSPKTQMIDAGGKLLLPGFNDAHVHFVSGGAQLENVQLNDVTSAEEFARRNGERA